MQSLTRTLCAALLLACFALGVARAEGLVDSLVRRFSESDFDLMHARSNAPLLPMAWVNATGYREAAFATPDGSASLLRFEQSSVSQGAFVPLPIGRRDALVIGEWLSWTQFDLDNSSRDLEVLSMAVPIGWARQSMPDWQLGAFVAPLGHRTPRDGWYWEMLGGVFARHTRGDRVAWLFGAYFDVSPLEDFYLPYLGATFLLNERWSINAVMPWPSITYAPSRDLLFRLGVAPSGASWSVEPGQRRPRMNFSAWNVGLAAERRIYKYVWLGFEAGVSGIRGLSLVGSDWQRFETKLDNTGFLLLTLNLRPSL